MLDKYPLHDVLKSNGTALGLILNMASAPLVEIASLMSFDFVMIDAEHGPISPADAEPMIRVAELCRIAPIVRVASCRPDDALRYLDLGAVGIMFPHIKTALDAREAVAAVRFPPLGKRGVAGSTNAAGYGVRMPFSQYLQRANDLLLPILIVEEPEAVENIESILLVEGLAAVVIGAMDLCAAMGFPGDPSNPAVEAAVDRVIMLCRVARMPVCLAASDLETSKKHLRRGANMLIAPIGSWLVGTGRAFTSAVRTAAP